MKRVMAFLIVGLIIAGLLLAIENSFVSMNKAIDEFSSGVLAERLKIVLYSIGLGIVFEWKKVVKMGKGEYNIHPSYILPLVLCLVLAIIPPFFVISYGSSPLVLFLLRLHTQVIFGILSGLLLVRMFANNNY